MGLHLSILAAANRLHRPRHGNAKPIRRLRPVVPNQRAEMTYRAGLLQLARRCRSTVEDSLHELESHWPRPTTSDSVRVGDERNPSIESFIRQARGKLGNLDVWAKRMAGIAAELNKDSVDTRLARVIREAIGVDVARLLQGDYRLRATMRAATDANIALIKSIPPQYFDRVLETVSSGWTQGMRWESLVEQIQHDGDVTEGRAKLIARDQTAKMNSSFNRERQQQVGIERYEWQTSGDERVRGNPAGKYPDAESNHWELDGKTFRWDEPGPCKGTIDGEPCHPGEDIADRCVAIPVVDMEALELDLGMAEQEQEREAA